MKNLRNSIIKMSMASISEIIDQQSLTSQLIDDNGLITTASSATSDRRGSEIGVSVDHPSLSHNSVLVVGHRTPSSSPVPALSAHNVVIDDHNVVAHTVVTTSNGTITDVEGAGPVVMVRTIIDGLSHSPVHSTFQTPTTVSVQSQHEEQLDRQLHNHHHLHQHQQHHQLVTSPHQQLLQIANTHQNPQSNHHPQQHHKDRLQAGSSVDFVGTDVTLDELSVCSSPNPRTVTNIIDVKQEDKVVVIEELDMGRKKIPKRRVENHCSVHRTLDVSHIDVDVGVGGIDDLSADAVEVTLNQHHHEHVQLQEQQLLHHHYGSGGGSRNGSNSISQHAHDNLNEQQQSRQCHQVGESNNHHRNTQHSAPQGHLRHQTSHHEALSVIVQQHEDSRDSASHILSPELGVVSVGVVGENSLEPTSYQTLTSVNERISPPSFSPTSSYATLTPLQPLPPISTMSDKFAYGGHINGSGVNVIGNCVGGGASSNSNSSSGGVGPFAVLPHQGSLGGLSLSSLSGVQSPYSSYDKLPSIGMSMSPPHNYGSSPSHTLSGMVVACELHNASPSPCGALSPQSAYSHSTELHSPTLSSTCKTTNGGIITSNVCSNSSLSTGATSLHINQADSQKQLICLSQPVSIVNDTVVGENVIVTGYESPYSIHQRDLLVTTTPSSSSTSGGRSSQLQLQHSPILSPHSISAGSVSLNSPGSCSMVNQPVVTLPPINGAMATLSAASLGSRGIADISRLERDAVVVSLTPSPPPNDMMGTATTLLTIQQPMSHAHHQQQQQPHLVTVTTEQHHMDTHPVTSDCNLNVSSSLRLSNVMGGQNLLSNNNILCNMGQQQRQISQQNSQNDQQQQLLLNIQHVTNINNGSNSSSGSSGCNTTGGGGGSTCSSSGGASGCAGSGGGSTLTTGGDVEEINTKELAQRISAELKRYSIPQAIFAQRVLCRSQGTLSDLLRNPKPWSKLKSGRETFRRMFKWLQEPEFQRMSALRMAAAQIPQRNTTNNNSGSGNNSTSVGIVNNNSVVVLNSSNGGSVGGNGVCRRKEEPHIEHMPQPKKPRLVFTDLQRRTLQAIFKETKRPSKEMQVTIARQLGLEPTTVGNFFMNARRRSMDKWRDDDSKGLGMHRHSNGVSGGNNRLNNNNSHHRNNHHQQHQHSLQHAQSLSPSNQHSLDLDDDGDMDLDLGNDDFDLDGEHDNDTDNDDML
ncbi:homeobox protein onecut [Zeugodacus cucurbitae]|uniref:homeobox protein onecut n=1 Tax=Zeugodacus cucurbitae TaxID=28588 RepID=UPI000596A9E6|nr:homeobox protein onecut [Zeugodacus cucurbitae]XP_028901500.1 homeobox protein onecut [Zeugodacus cucurbitae]